MNEGPLAGLKLLSFESRRATEIAQLIATFGGETISAPAMREVPLSDNEGTRTFSRDLEAGSIDLLVLLTGVGTTALFDIIGPRCPPERLRGLLEPVTIVARGPKPRAALRALKVEADHIVPEPNTWRELLDLVTSLGPLEGKRVAVQEYGRPNPELTEGLQQAGAQVLSVPVYRWAMPVDVEPLKAGVRSFASGAADIAIFTSAQQCNHIAEIAADLDLDLRRAAEKIAIASVGPVCTAELLRRGIGVDIEPVKPKMGPLVREIARRGPTVVASKKTAEHASENV